MADTVHIVYLKNTYHFFEFFKMSHKCNLVILNIEGHLYNSFLFLLLLKAAKYQYMGALRMGFRLIFHEMKSG